MRHSFARTLSKRKKRITLLAYRNKTMSTSAATTSMAINDAYIMGLMPENPTSRKRCEWLGGVGIWKLPGLQPPPPELISPASNPTSPSLAHWLVRNGCSNCCRACWKAGVMASTAEIGKTHIDSTAGSGQGTAKRETRQVGKERQLGRSAIAIEGFVELRTTELNSTIR